jgi:hypothetical protein
LGVTSTVLLLLAVAGAGSQTVVSSLSPTVGSLAGGTRLVITGQGFSRDRFTGGNLVYVGSYPCTVLNHKTSDTLVSRTCSSSIGCCGWAARLTVPCPLQITCVTSAAAGPGSHSVSVVVDGVSQTTRCCYTYSTEFTPSKATTAAQVAGSACAVCAEHATASHAVCLEHKTAVRLYHTGDKLGFTAAVLPPVACSAACCMATCWPGRRQTKYHWVQQLEA